MSMLKWNRIFMINLSSNFMHTALCFKYRDFLCGTGYRKAGAVTAHCGAADVIHPTACIHTTHLALHSK